MLRIIGLKILIAIIKFELAFSGDRDPRDIAAMKKDLLDREGDLLRAEINA